MRGSLINPVQLAHAVEGVSGVLEFSAQLAHDSTGAASDLVLRIVVDPSVKSGPEMLADTVAEDVRHVVGVRPTVRVVPATEVYRPDNDLKPLRFRRST